MVDGGKKLVLFRCVLISSGPGLLVFWFLTVGECVLTICFLKVWVWNLCTFVA